MEKLATAQRFLEIRIKWKTVVKDITEIVNGQR